MAKVLAMVLVVAAMAWATEGLGCMNDNGEEVDWWSALKTPVESDSTDPNVQGGVAYAYFDAESRTKTLTLTGNSLATDKTGSLWTTLAGVYGAGSDVGYLMFNDETPSGDKSGTKAHQKGVVAFNKDGGFWLIHSVPRFPNTVADGYDGFPSNEDKYGQSFLCISVSLSTINSIGALLYRSRPNVYDSALPSSLTSAVPNIASVLAGDYNHTAGTTVFDVHTNGGATFTAFSKNRQWDSDLYEDLVAPTLSTNLKAETWMNGVNPLPSYCKPQYAWDVVNIRTMALATPDGGEVMWKETQDHSKWAVASDSHYVCIGGINRQNGQRVRGGGTLCRTDSTMWAAFNGTVRTFDACT